MTRSVASSHSPRSASRTSSEWPNKPRAWLDYALVHRGFLLQLRAYEEGDRIMVHSSSLSNRYQHYSRLHMAISHLRYSSDGSHGCESGAGSRSCSAPCCCAVRCTRWFTARATPVLAAVFQAKLFDRHVFTRAALMPCVLVTTETLLTLGGLILDFGEHQVRERPEICCTFSRGSPALCTSHAECCVEWLMG
jgi:hypothetical protein